MLRAAAFMSLAILCFVAQDAAIKWLAGDYGVMQIVLLRTALSLALVLAFAAAGGLRVLRTGHPWLHCARGALLFVSGATFFYAFGHLPLADAYAILYMVPLASTLLAAMLLGERVPSRAAAAIATGLAGVGVVVVPQLGGGEVLAYAACVLGTLSYAFVGVITRKLSTGETRLAMLFYPCVVMVAISLPMAPFGWSTPAGADIAVFVAIGALWPLATMFFAAALKHGEVARIAPFEYSSIVWVVAVDFLLFGIVPAAATLAGSAVIIVACLLLIERRPPQAA